MNEPDKQTDMEMEPESEASESSEEAAEQSPGDGESSIEGLKAQLAEAQARADENFQDLLRARAELENYRKRSDREVQNARKFALERFMSDLLEVRESLERGLEAAAGEQVTIEQLKEGKALTYRMLDKVMERHGLTEIDPEGERFDPEQHEAISMIPTDEHEPDTVVTVVQKGYMLNDRLLRPARVIVARPSA